MKILVVYFSQTGNTKLIAETIHEALSPSYDVQSHTIRNIDLESLNDYDVLFIGAPCHDSDLAVVAKNFLERLPEKPRFKLAGFFTHATYPRNKDERARELYDKWAGRCHQTFERTCLNKSIEYLGHFNCQGNASPQIENFIHQEIITDEDEWKEYLPDLRTRPNNDDLTNAREFAQEIIAKL